MLHACVQIFDVINENFLGWKTVALSFLFDKYCLIME